MTKEYQFLPRAELDLNRILTGGPHKEYLTRMWENITVGQQSQQGSIYMQGEIPQLRAASAQLTEAVRVKIGGNDAYRAAVNAAVDAYTFTVASEQERYQTFMVTSWLVNTGYAIATAGAELLEGDALLSIITPPLDAYIYKTANERGHLRTSNIHDVHTSVVRALRTGAEIARKQM